MGALGSYAPSTRSPSPASPTLRGRVLIPDPVVDAVVRGRAGTHSSVRHGRRPARVPKSSMLWRELVSATVDTALRRFGHGAGPGPV